MPDPDPLSSITPAALAVAEDIVVVGGGHPNIPSAVMPQSREEPGPVLPRDSAHLPQRFISERAGSGLDHRVYRTHGEARARNKASIPLGDYLRLDGRCLDPDRFRACPVRQVNPKGRSQGQVYIDRWNHGMTELPTHGQCDLPFLRTAQESSYEGRLNHLIATRHRSRGGSNGRPRAELVAFEKPFSSLYFFQNRSRYGADMASESRIRHRDGLLFGWHNIEFHCVPRRMRGELYPSTPFGWTEAPQFLCVPTPPVAAYYGRFLIPSHPDAQGREDVVRLVSLVALSEFAVLSLFSILYTARDGFNFDTRHTDHRIYHQGQGEGPPGRLFWVSLELEDLIRQVGLPEIVEGSPFSVQDAESVLGEIRNPRVPWLRPAYKNTYVAWFDWRAKQAVPYSTEAQGPAEFHTPPGRTDYGGWDYRQQGRADTGWARAISSSYLERSSTPVGGIYPREIPETVQAPAPVYHTPTVPRSHSQSLEEGEMAPRPPFQPRRSRRVPSTVPVVPPTHGDARESSKVSSPRPEAEEARPGEGTTPPQITETVLEREEVQEVRPAATGLPVTESHAIPMVGIRKTTEAEQVRSADVPTVPSTIPNPDSVLPMGAAASLFGMLQDDRRRNNLVQYADVGDALGDLYRLVVWKRSVISQIRAQRDVMDEILKTEETGTGGDHTEGPARKRQRQ